MARRDKYSRIKPKVSPLTFVLVGLFFIGLILTIALSIDTPKQSFNKRFNLEDHNFELSKLKKVESKINDEEDLIVIVNVGLKSLTPANLLKELDKFYNEDEVYTKDNFYPENYPSKIYFVEVKDEKELKDFFEEYEIKKKSSKPMMFGFSQGELIAEFDSEHERDELQANDKAKANLILNVKDFLKTIKEELEK